MSEKDNIKLKTDTLSTRKSGSPASGVHVKRKRKIVAKPVSKDQKIDETSFVEKKQASKPSEDKITSTKSITKELLKISEAINNDNKSSKKQKNR